MLHLPYTGMVLGFVLVGAAISPRISWLLLGGTLLAYFLGLGIGAHLLDQVPGMGSRYVTRWPSWALWWGGSIALASAVTIGIVGSIFYVGPALLLLVGVQGVCAIGYPLAAWFRGAFHRDSVFAVSWGSLPFLTSAYAQAREVSPAVVLLAVVFGLVSLIEIRLSRASRRLRSEERSRRAPSSVTGDPGDLPYRRFDIALEALSLGTIVLSIGLVAGRWGFGV